MQANLPVPPIIATAAELEDLAHTLLQESMVAVDTESNSLFAYREQVCLIQFSTRTGDWLVDPLALPDMSPLEPLFSSPTIEKVFHAAEYDIMCMKRDYGFTFANLFDTMVSARIIGWKAFGLGNMLEEFFGVEVNKRYQRADWSQRPIPADQLRYAQQDTHYLLTLRDILIQHLKDGGHEEESREAFDWLAQVSPPDTTFDPEGYWRINDARDLGRRDMGVLRELYLFRDQLARRRNVPPFKVMGDDVLVKLVRALPSTLEDIREVRGGLSPYLIDRHGPAILQAIEHGLRAPLPTPPQRTPRNDPATQARYDALHDWRKARAIERGVESDVIIPKESLWALARTAPQTLSDLEKIPGMGPWKREKYGQELLNLLAGLPTLDS